jgi:ketosteroid isomerase-like protein
VQSNLEIVFSDWLDALRRGDFGRIASRLAPDVIHDGVRPEFSCAGRDVVLARMRKQAAHRPEVTALELIESGDQVVLSVRAATVGVSMDLDSDKMRGQATIVFTLRDGLIVRMRDYVTRDEALAAVSAPPAPVWQ